MNKELVNIISEQTDTLLYNIKTMILTCDLNFSLCGQPVWKHVYHALHSCDQWFINPQIYTEPPFHEPGLNSLDKCSEKALSKDELIAYYESVKTKVSDYLSNLTDEMLGSSPEGCKHSRLALILGQFRHLYAHLGNINCTTIIVTGEWRGSSALTPISLRVYMNSLEGPVQIQVFTAGERGAEKFADVLIQSAEWLERAGKTMWKADDLTVEKLLKSYSLNEMKLCYEDRELIGVYVLQRNDPLFWPELKDGKSFFLHKLAVCGECRGRNYGSKLIKSAELLCKHNNIEWLRLNCGTSRPGLRAFYENAGFKLLDRVFIDNRDQLRYEKRLV